MADARPPADPECICGHPRSEHDADSMNPAGCLDGWGDPRVRIAGCMCPTFRFPTRPAVSRD